MGVHGPRQHTPTTSENTDNCSPLQSQHPVQLPQCKNTRDNSANSHAHIHARMRTHTPYTHTHQHMYIRTNIIPVHISALGPSVTATWLENETPLSTDRPHPLVHHMYKFTIHHAHPIPRNQLQHTTTPSTPPSDSLKRCRGRLRKRHLYDPRHDHFTQRRRHPRRTKQIKTFADAKTRHR